MRKKKIIIFIVIVLIIFILGTCIYLFTDLFKSDKQLFYKYLLDKNNMFSFIEDNNQLSNTEGSYKANTQVDYIYQYNNKIEEIKDDQIVKNLQENIKYFEGLRGINAKVESKVDTENKKQYHNIQLKKIDDDVMKIDVVRNNDKYAFKIEQIVKAYIGLEDSNIKDLGTKLELPASENLPNKIDIDSPKYKELFNISKEDKEHIKNMYKDIFYNEIEKGSYVKENNITINIEEKEYKVNKYTLSLNKEQSVNLGVKVLEKLKQDSITLNLISNKIKTINADSEYVSIDKINEVIQKYIDELQKQEKNKEDYIKVSVYEFKGQTIRFDLYIKEEKKLQLDYIKENGEEKLYINQMFTKNETGAIIYDIKTSMRGANNIIITKTDRYLGVEVQLYDIKEIYKSILDEMNSIYQVEQSNNQLQQNDITKIDKKDIEEIENIYKQYENIDSQMSKIGFCIEFLNESDTSSVLSAYIKVCNSKIGMKAKTEKEYTNDIGEIETIDEKNTVFLNKYSKAQIENLLKVVYDKATNIIKGSFVKENN